MDNKNDKEWKRILKDFLKKLEIIHDKFTGKIEIDLNQGGIGSVKKTENL